MAKGYPHSSRRFTQIGPDAAPTRGQEINYDAIVTNAVNEIDSPAGPRDPANPAHPLYPGWVRMSVQEKIRAVIDAADARKIVKPAAGDLAIRLEKDVRDAYEKKHRRKR